MDAAWPLSPWVAEYRDRVAFQLQVLPAPNDPEQGKHLLAAGRLAEDLGFPAFSTGDHPGINVDPWVHLGVLATMTSRIRLGVVTACAAYRPPLLTARLAADVDRLSDGRLPSASGRAGSRASSPPSA